MGERKMGERNSTNGAASPWHIPVAVEEVAETGLHVDLVADPGVRAAVAGVAGLRELPRLEANFDVTRRGAGGLHVAGLVSATVGQTCVVSLEPLTNQVEETVDLAFISRQASDIDGEGEAEPRDVKWNDPEPLSSGVVDLGALAIEFLILGLNPYPRKPGAVFAPPPESKPEASPFAALAKLTQGRGRLPDGGQDGH